MSPRDPVQDLRLFLDCVLQRAAVESGRRVVFALDEDLAQTVSAQLRQKPPQQQREKHGEHCNHGRPPPARYWPTLRAFDSAAELLRGLAGRGWKIVLASSASARDLVVMRRVLDADDAITAATCADDVQASKPAPDLVHAALAKADAEPDQALFIGDTLWDVQAAAQAHVSCIGVLSGGFGERALRAAGALEVHADVGELRARLDNSALAHPERP
jgi:HAD superfamily hydrolase (TIGR01509 family)